MLASVEFASPRVVEDAKDEDEDDVDEWSRAIPSKGQPINPSQSLYSGKHALFEGARGPTVTDPGPSGTVDEVRAKRTRVSQSTSRSEATTELGPACDDEKHLCVPSSTM